MFGSKVEACRNVETCETSLLFCFNFKDGHHDEAQTGSFPQITYPQIC